MDPCQPVRQFLIDHFSMNDSHTGGASDKLILPVREHLARCSSCRLFQSDLSKLGGRLDRLEAKLSTQIQVPPLSYFESLITKHSGAPQSQPKANQVPAFLGTGIALLSGIGWLLQVGLIIPVGILYGLISMLLPLMLLIKKPGIENREVS